MTAKSRPHSVPDWALKINKLRESLRLDRAAFAARFGVSEMTVSNWLTGKKHPKPRIYLRMAQLSASPEDAAPFMKLAAERLNIVSPGMHKMFELQKKPVASARRVDFGYVGGNAVGIPLLKDSAAAGTPRQINEKEISEVLPLPKSLCPNAEHIVCIRVEGDSMSPVLEAGYIVAVDTMQRDVRRLDRQMVAARDPDGSVTIKWFRKIGKDHVLMPQHVSKRHEPVILSREGEEETGWGVVGKVLWWIGMPT